MSTRLSSDRTTVVDGGYHWREIASDPPTRGAKVQLIDRRYGVAVYGAWAPGTSWTHWAPLPTFAPGGEAAVAAKACRAKQVGPDQWVCDCETPLACDKVSSGLSVVDLSKRLADMTSTPGSKLTRAVLAVLVERERQVLGEGYDQAHDDEHDQGELAGAGSAYALLAADELYPGSQGDGAFSEIPPPSWPPRWTWKPCEPRAALVKAAALILAEIERLDRAAAKGGA